MLVGFKCSACLHVGDTEVEGVEFMNGFAETPCPACGHILRQENEEIVEWHTLSGSRSTQTKV